MESHWGAARAAGVGAALIAVVAVSPRLATQPASNALQAFVRQQLRLSDAQLSSLNQGRPIVKTFAGATKHEVTTAGGIRIRKGSVPSFVSQFKTLEGFRTSQFVLQIEKFSPEPQLRDLDPLIVDAEDLRSLRECRAGSCEVQLSPEDIARFRNEIKWNAPSADASAAALYKSILFAHLNEYRAGGHARLVRYHDQDEVIQLSDEIRALFDAKPSPLDHAPAFQQYLRHYPAPPPANVNVEDFFYWSKEEFGFKPVIGLNHVSVYTGSDRAETLIVTIQIYAAHYMHGQLAVNAMFPDPGGAGFYWLYLNRARVGPLGGFLGTLSRPIVQRRARAGLSRSLTQTKQRLEAGR